MALTLTVQKITHQPFGAVVGGLDGSGVLHCRASIQAASDCCCSTGRRNKTLHHSAGRQSWIFCGGEEKARLPFWYAPSTHLNAPRLRRELYHAVCIEGPSALTVVSSKNYGCNDKPDDDTSQSWFHFRRTRAP
jgi:hypothetical protein